MRRNYYDVADVLRQTATTAAPAGGAQPASDVNSTAARPEPEMDWPEGDLPSQGFDRTTLLPGIRVFKLPDNLAQLWAPVEAEDKRKTMPNGQPNPTFGQKVKRMMLKMTKNAPLVVVGGPDDGQPLTWNPSSSPRPRGKKDDPKTAWISELAYLYDTGLQGGLPATQRDRPKSIEALMAGINKYAGKTVRLKTGLSAQCRPEAVRYIAVQLPPADPGGQPQLSVVQDPTGAKGCGKRYYTKDFKSTPEEVAAGEGPYVTELACSCGAALRGFEAVDEILSPLGT